MQTDRNGIRILASKSFPNGKLPNKDEILLKEAAYFVKTGQHFKALLSLKTFGPESTNWNARLLYGQIERQEEKFDQALHHYNYVRDNAKNDKVLIEAMYGLAVTYRLMGDWDATRENLKVCERLLKKVPHKAYMVYAFSASAHLEMGDLELAKDYINRAKTDPFCRKADPRFRLLEKRVNSSLRNGDIAKNSN